MALVDGFSHLVVHVTDLDRSEKFYQDVFGLDVVGRNLVSDEGENSLLAMNTRQRILLVKVDEVVPFRPNRSSIHHAWLLTPEHQLAEQTLQLLPENCRDQRLLSIKRDRFTFGIPGADAIAMRQVPQGTPLAMSAELARVAAFTRPTTDAVGEIEATLRAAAFGAGGRFNEPRP